MRRAATIVGVMVMAWSGVASANVREVELLVVRLGTPDACAIDVEIVDVEMDTFAGNESLEISGMTIGSLASLTERGTTITRGTHVLFASAPFVTAAGAGALAPDVMISGAACERLLPAVQVRFIGTLSSAAGSVILPNDFGDSDAYGPNGPVDLSTGAVYVYDAAGARMIVGTGTPREEGAGCAVGVHSKRGSGLGLALGLALLALMARRRARG